MRCAGKRWGLEEADLAGAKTGGKLVAYVWHVEACIFCRPRKDN